MRPQSYQESGAALLITTTLATAVMMGYTLLSTTDSTLLSRKHQDHIAHHLSKLTFSHLRATINRAQTDFCNTDITDFIHVGQSSRPSPVTIDWNAIQDCPQLLPRAFPTQLVQTAHLDLALTAKDHPSLQADLELTMIITIKALGKNSQTRTTQHAASLDLTVMRYSDFGLILHGDKPRIHLNSDQIRLKVSSPTFISAPELESAKISDQLSHIEFNQPVYSRPTLATLGMTSHHFSSTYRKGLITNFAHLSDNHFYMSNTQDNPQWQMTNEFQYDSNQKAIIISPPPSLPPFYILDEPISSDNAGDPINCRLIKNITNLKYCHDANDSNNPSPLNGQPTPPQDISKIYHTQFNSNTTSQDSPLTHNCYSIDSSSTFYHPYIHLFNQAELTLNLFQSLTTPPDGSSNFELFCAIILANQLTLNLTFDKDTEFFLFGIIGVNKLIININANTAQACSDCTATLHIINPYRFRSHNLAPASSTTLNELLTKGNTSISSIVRVQNRFATTILRNLYLPLITVNHQHWSQRILSAQEFLYHDLNRLTPRYVIGDFSNQTISSFIFQPDDKTRSNLHRAYKQVLDTGESIFSEFGNPNNKPIYRITMDHHEMKVCDNPTCSE